ncbi:MAG: LutB/LldF family L-lactate oxidation iron-sulfur protein [Gemmatimonadota bacterium]
MSFETRPPDYRAASASILARTPEVRESVGSATRSFEQRRWDALSDVDSERWRDWARDVKTHALLHLDRYLEQAADRLEANGVHVHWAPDRSAATAVLDEIVQRHGVESVVKGKSMLSEELEVNEHLISRGVEPIETDLGEYIIQLLGEPPSHIVGPAIHRSLDDCRRLFHEKLGTPMDADPDALAAAARRALRTRFLLADMGISGGNFVAADTGTVALIENEGNIRLSTSVPPVHVAFVGIEKVVPRFEDLAGLLQLTARSATGQPIGLFVSLIQGPRREDEVDGPEHVHVVFVDNGRTRLLADERGWEALRCVRCGACLNSCPVYRQTGGHAYGWTYSGPIGAILAPGMLGLEGGMPLPHASSLCGACVEACPVRIPIPELLLHWRAKAVDEGMEPLSERFGSSFFANLAERPGAYRAAAAGLRIAPWKAASRALPVLGDWASQRTLPTPSPKSFRTLWREGIE